jgi:hypothetical protein
LYKKKGKGPSERSAQYLVVTPKTTTSHRNAPTTHPVRNISNNSSSGGGEKSPPSGKIESSHKFPVRKKIKNLIQEEEDNLIVNDIQSFSLDDMELGADIEKIFPTMEQSEIVTQQNVLLEFVANDIFSELESFTFQSVIFDKESKKLIVERGDQKNKKGKYRSEVDLKDMRPSQISKIHKVTSDALDDSIDGLEAENVKLKERIKELENALMALPILASPLSMFKPTRPAIKLKGSSSLLTTVRNYVEKNIKKRMSLITEAWEVLKNIVSFGSRAHSFHEYLQVDLKNKEGFYTNFVLPFGIKVSNMTKLRIREEDMTSPSRIKKLNACWKEKIKNLNNIVQACSEAILKRE